MKTLFERNLMEEENMPYKVAIVPGADDQHLFRDAGSFEEALKINERLQRQGGTDNQSFEVFSFSTEEERTAFIEGYQAGVGWGGDGYHFENNV